jgi:hypothetical protein
LLVLLYARHRCALMFSGADLRCTARGNGVVLAEATAATISLTAWR